MTGVGEDEIKKKRSFFSWVWVIFKTITSFLISLLIIIEVIAAIAAGIIIYRVYHKMSPALSVVAPQLGAGKSSNYNAKAVSSEDITGGSSLDIAGIMKNVNIKDIDLDSIKGMLEKSLKDIVGGKQ